MLASLLPGVRQLRAPLAAGYLWLFAAWLFLADRIPRPGEAGGGIISDVYEIGAAGGQPVIVGAATLAAYLVGVLSVRVTSLTPSRRAVRRARGADGGSTAGTVKPSGVRRSTLRDAVLGELAHRVDTDADLKTRLEQTANDCGVTRDLSHRDVRRELLDVRYDVESYVGDLEQDLPDMPLRLLVDDKQRDVHGEFDRRRAEAEFRAAVVLPLIVLVIVLGVRSSPWWLLAVVIPVLLYFEARYSARAAADVLAEYVRACPAQSAALDKVREGPLRSRALEDWWSYAAAKRYPGALTRQARVREEQGDLGASAELYRAAADLRDPTAMMWLAGRLHQDGDPEAEIWYAKAAEAGDPAATEINHLRDSLTPGQLSDLKEAHAGEATAMMRVGRYFEGQGQSEKARGWYAKARSAGEPHARTALVALLRAGGMEVAAEAVEQDDVVTFAGMSQSPRRTNGEDSRERE